MKKARLLFVTVLLIPGCKNASTPDIITNLPPYAVSGPVAVPPGIPFKSGDTVQLEFTDADGNPVAPGGQFDPDGDEVTFIIDLGDTSSGFSSPQASADNGILTIEWLDENLFKWAKFIISTSDGKNPPVPPIEEILVFFTN